MSETPPRHDKDQFPTLTAVDVTERRSRAGGLTLRLILALFVVTGMVASFVIVGDKRPERYQELFVPEGPLYSPARLSDAIGLGLSAATLSGELQQLMQSQPLSGVSACIDVRTQWGRVLFSAGDPHPKAIASNTKLFLTAAALLRLGRSSRFKTSVLGEVDSNGRAAGGLWLVGGGDPFLSTLEFKAWESAHEIDRPTTSLAELADEVVAAGVKSTSRVVGDPSIFDEKAQVAGHSEDLLSQKVIPPISGLSVNRNLKDWSLASRQTTNFVENPSNYAASEFARLLKERGVAVEGVSTSGKAPSGLRELAAVESVELKDTVTEINEESDNFAAEMLLKYLGVGAGKAGTTQGGLEVVTSELARLGLPSSDLMLRDGSGLSRNGASCSRIAELLVAVAGTAIREDFESSLAVAGSTGTLKKRFVNSPAESRIKAKTGSLNDVAALSGYVADLQGSRVVFALIVNAPNVERWRISIEDSVARILVNYPSRAGPRPIGKGSW